MKLIVQPADGTAPLLKGISQAKKSIQIVIFRFDQSDVEQALEEAAGRGVFVHALIAFTNRGGEKNLRRLEMLFLEKGITVARSADDLARYHGKMMLIDGKELYLPTYNFTHLDTARSRSFGIVTRNRELVQAASQLFECDTKRQPYISRCDKLVVSPVNARKCLTAFLKGAKRELLIYEINLADKEMLRILEDRRQAGVMVKIIGHVSGSKSLNVQVLRKMRLHTRVIICDSRQAFLGSQSLRKVELDDRREIGIMVNNRKIVSELVAIFESDWKASVAAIPRSERKQLINGHADRAARRVIKSIERKLAPPPVVKQVLKVIQSEANVKVDSAQATELVKGTLKKAVKKATAKIVEEALA